MREDRKPHLQRMSRRRFVKCVGAGAAVAAAATAGTLSVLSVQSSYPLDGSAVPIQNPAFRSAPGRREGHIVLFCQVGASEANDFLAFELNTAARAIWRLCAPWGATCSDSARSLDQIAGKLAGRLESTEVAQFMSLMHEKGLVYFADSESRIYWEYQSVR